MVMNSGKITLLRMPAVFILAWMIVLCAAGLVYAEPVMDISYSSAIGNHDLDRKSTRLNSSHIPLSRMQSSA